MADVSAPSPAIYLLPGLGGADQEFLAFSKQLCEDRPYEIVDVPDLTHNSRETFNIGVAVARLSDQISQNRGDQPYKLLGYSTGGLVAFLLAVRLAATGLPPQAVYMIDSVQGLSFRSRFEFVRKLRRAARKGPRSMASQALSSTLTGLRTYEILRWIILFAKRRDESKGEFLRKELLLALWRRSVARYSIPSYSGDVCLFPAGVCRRGVSQGDLGWHGVALWLRIVPLSGDHWSMMQLPALRKNLPIIAKQVWGYEEFQPSN